MSDFTPKTRLEKILCGITITARSGLEKAVQTAMARIASAVELPIVSAADNGDLLGVSGGKWAKVAPPVIPQLVFAVTGTLGEDAQHNATLTLNKTASQLYDAISAGKAIKLSYSFGADIETILPWAAEKSDNNGTVEYCFRFTGTDDSAYSVEDLSGSDTVVLKEETTT